MCSYAILTKETWPKWTGNVTDGVMHIVDTMHLDRREVQLGTSKVFIKSPESVSDPSERADRLLSYVPVSSCICSKDRKSVV